MRLSKVVNIFSKPRKHIVIACFQKSGSTYLYNILNTMTGYKLVTLVQRYGNNEQDMYEDQLKKRNSIDYISKQHVKGTENNIKLMKQYGIKPIILVRNIFDTVYSLCDHFAGEDHKTPTGYVHQEYFDMSEDEKMTYLIRVHIPWYFNFFVSWIEASKEIPCVWTSYEELFDDQVGTISKILDFYSIPFTEDQITQAIQQIKRKDTRFNVGKVGRGQRLSLNHKKEIEEIANAWKIGKNLWEKIGLQLE